MRPLLGGRVRSVVVVALATALVGGGGVAALSGHDRARSLTTADASASDLPEPFTQVQAFATKTGFRGIVAWEATTPIVAEVRYGTDPDNLDQMVPVVDTPDTAGMAVIGTTVTPDLEIGTTYYVSVTDRASGTSTDPIELVAKNAYNDLRENTEQDSSEVSYKPNVYTIDLLVQLDAQSLPEDLPADQALDDLAAGVNVLAERLYDAMDGHARVGKVLITDTNVAGLGSTPGYTVVHVPGTCDAPGNVADVLVTTAMPFDSHTFRYAIDEPCTPFYLGRVGQLVVPWEDDLHLGYTATHEMMHYAFGAPDLYGTGDVTGAASGGCTNPDWDGSLMHNSGGWKVDHWELTEIDRSPSLTPCDHAGEPYTWDEARSRYEELPDASDPTMVLEDVHNDKARGNPDGGALEISILDREPLSSTLRPFAPDDTDTGVGSCPPGPRTSTSFTDDEGDATSVLGLANLPTEANEPALDILGEQIDLVPADAPESLVMRVDVSDLKEEPASGSLGEWFDIEFSVDGRPLEVVAEWDRTAGDPTYTLNEFDGSRSAIGAVEGTWSVDDDFVTVTIPATLTLDDTSAYTVFGDGSSIRGFRTTSRRVTGVVVPDADTASGGCVLRVPGTAPVTSGVDAELSLPEQATYTFLGEATTAVESFVAGPLEVTGSATDEKVIKVVSSTGATLTAELTASPTSYAILTITGPDGGEIAYAEAPAGQTVSTSARVVSGVYRVTFSYLLAVESTYEARLTLGADTTPPTGTPDGAATLASGGSEDFDGTAPADTTAYECTGPFDPSCRTYAIEVTAPGELSASIEADVPADDFDLYIYDANGSEVGGGGGLPGTPPAGLESAAAPVTPGHYFVVVQPYIAFKDLSSFHLTVSLS